MGNYLTYAIEKTRGTKRKRDETDSPIQTSLTAHVTGAATGDVLETPRRKRIKSTSNYIYQTLFLDGINSDVTISAIGKEWKLHKLYLSQSPYFQCMFSGSWKESSLSQISIEVTDNNIDEEALKIAFGSLYKDYVFIKPVQVVKVLAAAMLLQLEGLIDQCTFMMKETISDRTVCSYYSASERYGLQTMAEDCHNWLLSNVLSNESPHLLQDISTEKMTDLVASSDLSVMQVEMDVYTLLKKWMFIKLKPSWSGNNKDLSTDCDNFFRGMNDGTDKKKPAFLTTSDGQMFLRPFCKLRWHHLLTDLSNLKLLERDNIIDLDWIRCGYEHHWREMLRLEQGQYSGPEEIPDQAIFDCVSLRCGRVLKSDQEYCWRWVGYNYGVDLLVTFMNNVISLKRNTHSQSCPHAVTLQKLRHVIYRLKVACYDENGKMKNSKSTGLKHTSFGIDEEQVVMTLGADFDFPLHVTLNLLMTKPPDSGHPAIKLDCNTIQAGLTTDHLCDTGVQTLWEQPARPMCDIAVQTVPCLGQDKEVQTISCVS